MKEEELREKAICNICNQKIGKSGAVTFYTVKIKHHIVNLAAVQRQAGLEMMMGNILLGKVMGPDEEMTKTLNEVEITICQDCSVKKINILAKLEDD